MLNLLNEYTRTDLCLSVDLILIPMPLCTPLAYVRFNVRGLVKLLSQKQPQGRVPGLQPAVGLRSGVLLVVYRRDVSSE